MDITILKKAMEKINHFFEVPKSSATAKAPEACAFPEIV